MSSLRTPADRSAPSPREAVLEHQRRLFQKLLRKVWRESAFYRDYYASHGIREQDLPEVAIEDCPFLSKKILMENFDRATTDARLRRRELEKWLDEVRDPRQLFAGDFIVINGSGSSGTTGISVYSRTDWHVMNSIMTSRLPQPENYPAGKTRVAFYRVAHGHFAGVSTAVHLPKAVYDTLIVSFLGSAKDVIEQLQRFQPHRLTGYSSSVTVLAEQAIEGKLRIQPQRIFVSGDLLTKDMEQKIHQAWGAPISNLYGASESLFLAVKDADDEEMTVMDDLNILEILDGENRPVGPGEEGRVTITNLYNYTLPTLRYELDDYVTKGNRPRASGLSSIQDIRPGKTHDALPIVLDNGARDTLIPGAMTSFYAAGLERAQFIFRPPDRIQIDYLAKQNIDRAVRSEFQRILNMKGASRMTFEVRRVSSILADPVTGKVRLVLPHGSQAGPSSPVFVNDVHPEVLVERVSVPKSALVFKKTDVEQSIPERFERLVQKHPDRPAVKSRDRALSYDGLNRAGNRVAQAILARRGEGEEPIALLLGHAIPALVTILGVLKAGKFYVPLSPSYPRARLAAIVEDADASLIVTNNSNLPSAMALAGDARHILNIDDLDANLPDRNPGLSIRSDALAYLLYTSGSTGRPKGVVQTHRNVLHQIMTYSNGLTISAADRLTLLHSHCFSAARLDIFGALLNGAALFPLPVAQEGVVNLAQRLIEEEITLFHWVPTAFRQFIDGLSGQERFPKLRLIVLGSEPLASADVEMYKKHFAPSCVLVNRYGTTETGNVRWYFIDKQTQIPADVVPVGYAIEDTEVFILDETGNELGNHQVGEIAVKGPYLAPGYWKQAELSRAAFLSDPLAPDKKIYRTGDMGYMLPDGCMFHVGRKDFQVKVRGHRVEVGEIEKALREHTAIREAVVMAREKTAGDKQLVAYFVVGQETPPTVGALRGFLEARLPSYMIPELFVQLESLPLLPNGKLDRGALRPLDGVGPAMDTPIAEPRTPVENALAQIWSESLGVSRIGIHDNFFDLGGHSLLAGKIISQVTRTFKVEITFRDFFELPTVAHMANIITRNATVLGDEQLIKILNELDLLSDEKARELLEQNRK